jgi:hypothetical protein
MLFLLFLVGRLPGRRLELRELRGRGVSQCLHRLALNALLDRAIERVVAVELGQQVAQRRALVLQLLEALHALHERGGIEIVHRSEGQPVGILALGIERAVDSGELGRYLGENVAEIVAVDFHERTADILEREAISRNSVPETGQVCHNPGNKRNFLLFYRVTDFDIIGDLHARRPVATDLVLGTICHRLPRSIQ